MRVSIIGLGLIGGSLAIDLRASGFATRLIGVDSSREHCRQALERGLVDAVQPLKNAVAGSELVILAIPVNAIAQCLPIVLDNVSDSVIVTDMGSTKGQICRAVEGHPRRAQFVASHPMAGTEHSGPTAAFAGLFANRTGVICDREKSSPEALRLVEDMYLTLKMRLVYLSSVDHDLHAAYVSHLSHISSFVLANTVLDKEKNVGTIFDLAGGGFESTVRLAKSSPEMWMPIFEQNREHIIAALEAYMEHMKAFHQSLTSGPGEQTRGLMARANEIRRVLANIVPSGKPETGGR